LSLDAPMGGDEDGSDLGDLIGDEDDVLERVTDMETVETHWSELPRREQQILLLRFYGNHTQEEVARRLGISQMHVSRLQARALARLRGWLLGPEGKPAVSGGRRAQPG
jgi:RNA polymerase sigma-B factor